MTFSMLGGTTTTPEIRYYEPVSSSLEGTWKMLEEGRRMCWGLDLQASKVRTNSRDNKVESVGIITASIY